MATWKKVITSGSAAELSQLNINASQQITALQSTTYLSGSFTGSFTGTFAGPLTGTASWATNAVNVAVTDTTTGTGPYYVTFVDGTTGTKGVRVDSTALTFNATTNTLTVTSSYAAQALTASFAATAPYSGLIGTPAGIVSASVLSSPSQGNAVLTTNGVAGSTIDLGLTTTANPTFNNLIVSGDLTVNGTTTTLNTNNLLVEDRFILLSSGSLTANDGGIIVQSATGGVGYAFYFDSTGDGTAPRWSMAEAASSTATTLTPTYYVGAITGSGVAPSAGAPTYGFGTMHVNSANGDIYIYA